MPPIIAASALTTPPGQVIALTVLSLAAAYQIATGTKLRIDFGSFRLRSRRKPKNGRRKGAAQVLAIGTQVVVNGRCNITWAIGMKGEITAHVSKDGQNKLEPTASVTWAKVKLDPSGTEIEVPMDVLDSAP